MKILLETSPLRNAHSVRGVGVYTRYLSKELEKLQNSDFEFITSEDSPLDQLNAFMEKHSVDIIHYPYFDLFRQTLPVPLVQQLTGRKSQKIVVTIHDVIPLLYPEHYPAGIKGSVGLLLQKWLLQSVSAVITDSNTSKQDITKYLHYPKDKIFVTPLSGNPDIAKVAGETVNRVRKKLNLPSSFFLYVGDINYNKNIPELIKALDFVDQSLDLVCVGTNFRDQSIPEWQAIKQVLSNREQRVHFITTIEKNDTETLSALYSAAAVYVQPSLYEGFGLPLLEAASCETLIVSSNTPALHEIQLPGILFVAPDAQHIAKGVTQVLTESHIQKANRIKQNTQNLKCYSWEKAAKETLKVYESLA